MCKENLVSLLVLSVIFVSQTESALIIRRKLLSESAPPVLYTSTQEPIDSHYSHEYCKENLENLNSFYEDGLVKIPASPSTKSSRLKDIENILQVLQKCVEFETMPEIPEFLYMRAPIFETTPDSLESINRKDNSENVAASATEAANYEHTADQE